MNTDWAFYRGDVVEGSRTDLDDSGWIPVALPHFMQLEMKHCGDTNRSRHKWSSRRNVSFPVAETVLNAPLESFTGTINYDEKDPYKRAVISGVELVENRSFSS